MTTPGWYFAEGDPPGMQRYWDGEQWVGEPVMNQQPTQPGMQNASGSYVPAQPAGGIPPVSAGRRIVGRIIDAIIGVLFGLALAVARGRFRFDASSDFDNLLFELQVDSAIGSVVAFVWSVAWIHLAGGTPGKRILGMRVLDAATGKTPVDLAQASMRSLNLLLPVVGAFFIPLGQIIGIVLLIVGLVSLVFLFTDDRRRTVMDQIAKTVVDED